MRKMTGKLVAGPQAGGLVLSQEQAAVATGMSLRGKLGGCRYTPEALTTTEPLIGSASLCPVCRGGVNSPAQSMAGLCCVHAVPQDAVILMTANLPDSPTYLGSLAEVNAGCLFQS